ncbi:MAG: response regulator [Rubripirellula sp.]|nr:response regulator [Rubripirellula sp.]
MTEWFTHLFSTNGFPARWNCGAGWEQEPALGWLHIGSDIGIFVGYYAVPIVVAYYLSQKPEIWKRFPKVFWALLALVFFSCGTVHLIEAIIFWSPHYRLSALFKTLTCSVSLVGVYVLCRSLPIALNLKTPAEYQIEINERQQAELQLELERNLLHTLMNHLPDAIYFKDFSGKYLRISRSLANSLNLQDSSEAIGKSESDFLSDIEQFANYDKVVMASGQAIIGQVTPSPWDKTNDTWLSISRLPLYDRDQMPIGTFGIAHDITAIKRSEQRFAMLAQRLALPPETNLRSIDSIRLSHFCLQDMITCGSDIRGMGWTSDSVNELKQNIVEYLYQRLQDADGNPALSLVRIFQTERFDELEPELQAVAQTAVPNQPMQPHTRCLILRGTKGIKPEWNNPNQSRDHRVIPLPNVEAVNQLPMIQRMMQELGIEVGKLLDSNDEPLTRESPSSVFYISEAEGRDYLPAQDEFVIPNEIRSVVGFGELMPTGDMFAVLCFSRVPISHRTAVLFSHLSISVKLALLAMDPSGQRVEAQIQSVDTMLKNYEGVVCDQEKLIKQAMLDLEQARDEANKANQTKSEFLANMSHEIRTPMNVIMGMTELVLEGKMNETEREYLNAVLDSADSLLGIINEILDFSKIEAGKLEIHALEFDVREEVGDMVRSLAIRAHRKQIELTYEIAPNVPATLVCDVARLRQVIVNLVGNAIKFTEQGEVVVYMDAMEVAEKEAKIRFRVVDTGIGIAPDRHKSIFDAFAQADGSTTRVHGGTGLGLSICASIVDRLGGRIELKSEVDRGSEFSFIISMPVGSEDPATNSQPADLLDVPVLLVDDNETNLQILHRTVTNWGMSSVSASNATDALEALASWDLALKPMPILITDVHMPHMDGYELVEKIRDQEKTSDLPVVVLTSGALPGDPELFERLDVVAHLMKPCKQRDLMSAVLNAHGSQMSIKKMTRSSEASTQPTRSLNILLAEDGIANQKLAATMLQRWGHRVMVAENGAIAVKLYNLGDYDLILMDVQMPEMDGLEATRKIRSLEASTQRHTPIIAMTAHALVGDRQRCLQAGMDHYLSKPIHKEKLVQALEMFEPQSGKENESTSTPDEGDSGSPMLNPNQNEIDLSGALQVMEGQVDILVSVIEALLEEAPELLKQLDQGLAENDVEGAGRAAHTIKGGFRILQLDEQVSDWDRLETWAREGKLDEVSNSLDRVKQATLARMAQLQKFVDDHQE